MAVLGGMFTKKTNEPERMLQLNFCGQILDLKKSNLSFNTGMGLKT